MKKRLTGYWEQSIGMQIGIYVVVFGCVILATESRYWGGLAMVFFTFLHSAFGQLGSAIVGSNEIQRELLDEVRRLRIARSDA